MSTSANPSPDPHRSAEPAIDRAWHGPAFALAIVALTCLAYIPAFNAGFIWDDDHYITDNRHLESLNGLYRIWCDPGATYDYYPLAFTTHWIEYHVWGHWAPGYHAVNILMHAGNAILLWRLLLHLRVPGAWLGALLFALHPVQVESVAWCTERKTLLATMLGLTAFHGLLRYQPPEPSEPPMLAGHTAASSTRRRWPWLALALLAFLAALFAKVTAVTFPPAIGFILWWREGRAVVRRLPVLGLMLLIAIPICALSMWTQTHIVGADGASFGLTHLQRILLVGRTSCFYLTSLLFPSNLTFIYPRWTVAIDVWWQWLFLFGAVGLVVALFVARRRIGIAPLAVLLAYGVMLGPALGLFKIYWQVYSYVADHVQYAAAAAPLSLFAAGAVMVCNRLSGHRYSVAMAAASVVLIALGALTAHQTRDYHDLETLWRRTLAKNPDASIAHNNLGTILIDRGKPGDAARHFREAIRLRPDHVKAMASLGRALFEMHQEEEALIWLQRAIDHQPPVSTALNTMGVIYAQRDEIDQAINYFRRATRADRSWPDPHYNLGTALLKVGKLDEARASLQSALAIKSNLPNAHYQLGQVYEKRHDDQQAFQHYSMALHLAPNNAGARRGLGGVLLRQQRFDEAMEQLGMALRGNPRDALAWQFTGMVLAAQQRWPEAQDAIGRAIEIDPKQAAECHNVMGVALARAGKLPEAAAALRRSLQLRPDYADARDNLNMIERALTPATQPKPTTMADTQK